MRRCATVQTEQEAEGEIGAHPRSWPWALEMVSMAYSSSAGDDLHGKKWTENEEEEMVLQQIKRTRHRE